MNDTTTKPAPRYRATIRRAGLAVTGAAVITAATVITPALAEPAAAAWYEWVPLTRGFNCRWFNLC